MQYLLGMTVNVFVVLPAQHPGAKAANYFGGAASGIGWLISSGPGWAAAHAAFGLALVARARRDDGVIQDRKRYTDLWL